MPESPRNTCHIAVVIPCYKVSRHILEVIGKIGPDCWRIYVVDDACPEHSGRLVAEQAQDPRIRIIHHEINQGVGGAVMTGYRQAIEDGADIVVKIDGDGQLDPALMEDFIAPLINGQADYAKGNRFYDLDGLHGMPKIRIFGNAVLSFFSKLSSGYWDLFDPANGYTAIRTEIAAKLPFAKISRRYFFESDMLFQLNIARAVVVDVPMSARYADEISNLRITRIAGEFLCKHLRNFARRILYNYFLRDMSLASLELVFGFILFFFGSAFGLYSWHRSLVTGIATTAGTVMLAALPVLLGLQFLLAFIGYDIASIPRYPRSKPLPTRPDAD